MKLQIAKLVVVSLTLGGLACIAGVLAFLFVPTLKEVWKLSGEITLAHAELDAQYADRKNLLSSLGKTEQARADMRKLSAQFLPEKHELDLITAVEDLASRDGVEERITLSANDGTRAADELRENFDLTVNGKYRSVMQALVDIEKMPTMLIFAGGNVRPGPGAAPGDESFLSVVLRGSVAIPPKGL